MEGKLQGKRAFFQDYRKPWFYMVTMTTLGRVPIFGKCRNHAVDLSSEGQIAEELWRAIPQAYPQLEMQAHIIMQGVVIVSPFISPGEKEVAEMVMGMACGNIILMKPVGFGDCYKPSGRYFDLCAQGRVLILSAFADTSSKVTLTRERCLSMNAWCEAICEANGDIGDQN